MPLKGWMSYTEPFRRAESPVSAWVTKLVPLPLSFLCGTGGFKSG